MDDSIVSEVIHQQMVAEILRGECENVFVAYDNFVQSRYPF